MWKEKLGNYLIDISKYVITGVVISSMFNEVANKIMLYVTGVIFAAISLTAGLMLVNKKEKKGK